MTDTQHDMFGAYVAPSARDCHGMPPGFESPCGVITGPHGPHTITPEQAVTPTSQEVSRRFDRLAPKDGELHFLLGWMISAAPAAVDDALDAMEHWIARKAVK